MKKQLQKFFAKKNNKGFTLIELIIVIAILAILIGIVGMASIRYVEKSRKSADEQTLDSISTAVQALIVDPDNNLTVSGGSIVVTKSGTGVTVAVNGVTAPSGTTFDWDAKVKNDLAKEPSLKSQFYKDGAYCTITVTGTGADETVKVGTWNKGTSTSSTPATPATGS